MKKCAHILRFSALLDVTWSEKGWVRGRRGENLFPSTRPFVPFKNPLTSENGNFTTCLGLRCLVTRWHKYNNHWKMMRSGRKKNVLVGIIFPQTLALLCCLFCDDARRKFRFWKGSSWFRRWCFPQSLYLSSIFHPHTTQKSTNLPESFFLFIFVSSIKRFTRHWKGFWQVCAELRWWDRENMDQQIRDISPEGNRNETLPREIN